ncbi:MAG TPA: amino acid ABC transporter permease [Xanthobacteraceae bacterium]|nr:amino acid ABC transporter permease [Xanthobacteraceae bacterium]
MADIARPPARHARRLGDIALQVALVVVVGGLAAAAAINAAHNLAHSNIATGFGFWNNTAGFDISQTLIAYSASTSTFGRAFWVGLLNTLLVSGIGIVLATILGFIVGLARLSRNWLVARLAGGYVELIRNVPLLLQILFWYNAVLKALPELRGSVALPFGGFLNNRGLFLPRPEFAPDFDAVVIALLIGIAATLVLYLWARRRQDRTGEELRIRWYAVALIGGLPLVVFVVAGAPLSFSQPGLGRFNVRGGLEILPEFAALLIALTVYTAAFIAEVVRAGVLAVPHGQTEAAQALGLRSSTTLRRIIVPQAMRVIVPPLTSQYLALIKNSSLAVAIGYPDLVQVFAGSVLNITGQAVEVIAITMAVYLSISLVTSLLMNLYGRTTAIVER